ncbi:hypothetical protein C8F01DRAFT_543472 [Mycena amicta]|nr:hypothetical protein C8F01DRAFT_543472 [Mycena amicta]
MFALANLKFFALISQYAQWKKESDSPLVVSPTSVLEKARARLSLRTGKVITIAVEANQLQEPVGLTATFRLDTNRETIRPRFGSAWGRTSPGKSPLHQSQVAPVSACASSQATSIPLPATTRLGLARRKLQRVVDVDSPPTAPVLGLTATTRLDLSVLNIDKPTRTAHCGRRSFPARFSMLPIPTLETITDVLETIPQTEPNRTSRRGRTSFPARFSMLPIPTLDTITDVLEAIPEPQPIVDAGFGHLFWKVHFEQPEEDEEDHGLELDHTTFTFTDLDFTPFSACKTVRVEQIPQPTVAFTSRGTGPLSQSNAAPKAVSTTSRIPALKRSSAHCRKGGKENASATTFPRSRLPLRSCA